MGRRRSEAEGGRGQQSLTEFAGADEVASPKAEVSGSGYARTPDWAGSAPARPGDPTMGAGFERIVEHVFKVDVWAEYEELEAGLKFDGPAHRKDYSELVDALDEATDNALRASRLVAAAKAALEVFEFDVRLVQGDMRGQAVAALQAEKETGARTKQITDADVESWMASRFADEYRAHTERRAKAKRMVDNLERLADLWKVRCGTLDTMVKGARRL